MDIKKILVPTDFSEANLAALEYASRLASQTGAMLYIVHADNMEQAAAIMAKSGHPYPFWQDEPGHREGHVKLKKVVPTERGVKYRHQYLKGTPTGEIVSFAKRNNVDLIVMASHGRTGLSRLLMGSTAEGVMRRATCPVLIVKQPTKEETLTIQKDAIAASV
jgi:nucleotide-binding universal stress UspA family protein